MELRIAKRYPVAASLAQAWTVLGDLPLLAACMPGAQLSETLGENRHRGLMKTKVGPASLLFQGEIELLERDEATHRLRLTGKGKDAGSAASLQLVAWLEPAAEGCTLVGEATVSVNGKLAQIGNRLLAPASDALLAQFVQNFSSTAAAVAVSTAITAPATPVESRPPPAELNALALLLTLLSKWWRGLFQRKDT